MDNEEYAACIYKQLKLGSKVMKATGVLDEINKLDERYQQALKYYYRDDMTYEQVGKKLGVSRSRAREITLKALRLLKHPYRSRNMHRT